MLNPTGEPVDVNVMSGTSKGTVASADVPSACNSTTRLIGRSSATTDPSLVLDPTNSVSARTEISWPSLISPRLTPASNTLPGIVTVHCWSDTTTELPDCEPVAVIPQGISDSSGVTLFLQVEV